ncbi:hypothetical protein BDK51DRAFT_33697, partial [Blyttiomyces helicus]
RPVDLPRARLINTSVDTSHEISAEEIRFPWDPTSKPPLVAEILCGYRDYTVNTDLQHLVAARLREGFALRSVHVTHRTGGPDKVEVILAMPWLLNVTIQYTIKTSWTTTDRPLLVGATHRKPPQS